MTVRIRLLLMACLAWPVLVAEAAGPSIDGFVGAWTGEEVTAPAAALEPDALSLRVERAPRGFRIAWRDLEPDDDRGERVEAHFVPTARPGVYEYAEEPGSLLERMFSSPASGNPLEGDTLLWARIEGASLVVYSMSIDPDGAFDLGRYAWTRSGDGLELAFTRRTEDLAAETRIEGTLKAGGG